MNAVVGDLLAAGRPAARLSRSRPRTRMSPTTPTMVRSLKAKLKLRPIGILPGPVALDEGLADDRDELRSSAVSASPTSRPAGRDVERLEESGRDEAHARGGVAGRRSAAAVQHDRPDAAAHHHRQEADIRRARHAGQRADLAEHAGVESAARAGCAVLRQRQRSATSARFSARNPGSRRLDGPQRADQQAGGDEQHDRRDRPPRSRARRAASLSVRRWPALLRAGPRRRRPRRCAGPARGRTRAR